MLGRIGLGNPDYLSTRLLNIAAVCVDCVELGPVYGIYTDIMHLACINSVTKLVKNTIYAYCFCGAGFNSSVLEYVGLTIYLAN